MVEYQQEKQLDTIFMALAHPIRREVIHILANGSQTMNELAAPFSISLAALSKHVKTLERAGLVERRIAGRTHHISLVATPLTIALDWISIYRKLWSDHLDSLMSEINNRKE